MQGAVGTPLDKIQPDPRLTALWGRQTPLHLPSYKHVVPRKCTEGDLTYSRHQGRRI